MNTGIIGFFDILGYKSFLMNSHGDAARQVVSKLVSLEESIAKKMRDEISIDPKRRRAKLDVDRIMDPLKWLVFSDTILLYTPLQDSDSHSLKSARWLLMDAFCKELWLLMFEYGLPLRGIIHTGEFHVEKSCFAGQAIIEAYEMIQNFDLAVCVYSETAFTELVRHANEPYSEILWGLMLAGLFDYDPPQKKSKPGKFVAINPLAFFINGQDDRYFDFGGDLHQVVRESFSKHGKTIPKSAETKINNTEQFLKAARGALGNREEMERILRFSSKPYFKQ